MKRNHFKYIHLLALLFSLLAVSCADDFPYSDPSIPEGEGILSATVTFTPTAASDLGMTRTPGDAIQDIESLCVLVYDKDRKLLKKYTKGDLKNYADIKYNVDKDKDHLDGNQAHTDETTTARATFQIPDLPFGQYYIFAVANMGDLSAYETEIETVEGLQNISLTWDTDDIGKNNQMFGYFTTDNDMKSNGFEPEKPLVFTGRQANFKIHAWLKRAASKVTVAFDPSGLNQGVTIYIRNVTVRDIPKTCLLGAENTPTSADDLYNYLSKYDNPNYQVTSPAVANSRLEYDANGVIMTEGEHTGDNSTDGYRLDNSIRSAVPADAHAVDAPSLFFYENNQNPWLEKNVPDYKDNPRYDKHPQTEGEDKIGNTIHDAENDKDFKDRVPFGTYVEVEAYYISSNPANPGEGSIKYRFMLGKDTSFDYNAQRNYHYKLTLGFKGWANDPDWHIDYVVTTPDVLVPPVFRVSYLYHQMSELPIKIVGDIEYLTATITENNWAPYDPNPDTNIDVNGYKVPQTSISTTPSDYIFQWNLEAFRNPEYMENGKIRNEFGFLSLHLPNRNTTVISKGYSADANDDLIKYYNDNKEGERRFRYDDLTVGEHRNTFNETNSSEDDVYKVNNVLNDAGAPVSGQCILMLPVWTRALTLIVNSGLSGNNPYEAFERKAVLHIVAQFKDDAKTRLERDVEIFQVKRITNPKGVWRAYDRSESFNVTLLEAKNSNAESDFQPFTSQGEWSAYIESQTNSGGFSIRPNGETNGYMQNGTIHGNTGSTINFAIDFGGNVGENGSECAIIKVLYHGNQCLHKILVRKGYNSPLRMGNAEYTTSSGEKVKGRLWSSFSLYQASYISGTDGVNDSYNAVLTKNPLMLGSMFRRGRQTKGIFVRNNQRPELGPFKDPGNTSFIVGLKGNGTDGWTDNTWTQIGYRDDRESLNTGLGTFISEDGTQYKVPSYDDFKDLTDSSEFAFGVFYGSAATKPALTANEAYGLIDPQNEGLFNSENGMRGVVAYDKSTGNQIFFPMGRYGTGRRNNFVLTGNKAGQLRYGDVDYLLTIGRNANNLYRPVPYNLMISSGNIYWIDKYYPTTDGCLGWDMNYFNFDFKDYTANNYRDACPIKFVVEE